MKNLFLGIRQYDCDADWDKLIHIAKNSCPDSNYAGFQTKFFNHPVLNSIKDSFISCCSLDTIKAFVKGGILVIRVIVIFGFGIG